MRRYLLVLALLTLGGNAESASVLPPWELTSASLADKYVLEDGAYKSDTKVLVVMVERRKRKRVCLIDYGDAMGLQILMRVFELSVSEQPDRFTSKRIVISEEPCLKLSHDGLTEILRRRQEILEARILALERELKLKK